MFKRLFAIHIGGGLFLSNLLHAVEHVAVDAAKIAVDAAPIVLEVTTIAGAATVGDFPAAVSAVAALVNSGHILAADIHEVFTSSARFQPSAADLAGIPSHIAEAAGIVAAAIPAAAPAAAAVSGAVDATAAVVNAAAGIVSDVESAFAPGTNGAIAAANAVPAGGHGVVRSFPRP